MVVLNVRQGVFCGGRCLEGRLFVGIIGMIMGKEAALPRLFVGRGRGGRVWALSTSLFDVFKRIILRWSTPTRCDIFPQSVDDVSGWGVGGVVNPSVLASHCVAYCTVFVNPVLLSSHLLFPALLRLSLSVSLFDVQHANKFPQVGVFKKQLTWFPHDERAMPARVAATYSGALILC